MSCYRTNQGPPTAAPSGNHTYGNTAGMNHAYPSNNYLPAANGMNFGGNMAPQHSGSYQRMGMPNSTMSNPSMGNGASYARPEPRRMPGHMQMMGNPYAQYSHHPVSMANNGRQQSHPHFMQNPYSQVGQAMPQPGPISNYAMPQRTQTMPPHQSMVGPYSHTQRYAPVRPPPSEEPHNASAVGAQTSDAASCTANSTDSTTIAQSQTATPTPDSERIAVDPSSSDKYDKHDTHDPSPYSTVLKEYAAAAHLPIPPGKIIPLDPPIGNGPTQPGNSHYPVAYRQGMRALPMHRPQGSQGYHSQPMQHYPPPFARPAWKSAPDSEPSPVFDARKDMQRQAVSRTPSPAIILNESAPNTHPRHHDEAASVDPNKVPSPILIPRVSSASCQSGASEPTVVSQSTNSGEVHTGRPSPPQETDMTDTASILLSLCVKPKPTIVTKDLPQTSNDSSARGITPDQALTSSRSSSFEPVRSVSMEATNEPAASQENSSDDSDHDIAQTVSMDSAPDITSEPSSETVDDLPAKVPAKYPTRLALDQDQAKLNTLHCFLRSELLEVFIVQKSSSKSPTHSPGSSVGRVGLRCVHCALNRAQRERDEAPMAVFYPKSIGEIYRLVTSWQRCHLRKCKNLPPPVKSQWISLRENNKSRGKTHYWVTSAKDLGLIDCQSRAGGIRFRTDLNESL